MLKRLILLTFVCTIAALVASCVTPTYKLSGGYYKLCKDNSSPDKVAILIINKGYYVEKIDGSMLLRNGSLRIELLPGEHSISVGFDGAPGTYSSLGQLKITFNVEAGRVYTVAKSVDTANQTWKAWVEETNIRCIVY